MSLLEENIHHLCEELKISPLPQENEEKVFSFLLNDEISLYFQDLDPGFYLWSTLAPCPQKSKEDLFMFLMKANLFGQGTGGSVISLDENEKFLTLSLALAYEVSYQGFKENVEDFVNYVFYWRKQIEEHIQKANATLY